MNSTPNSNAIVLDIDNLVVGLGKKPNGTRIIYGGRISLLIGLGAAVFSVSIGLVIGLVSGFFKWVDAVMMRVMDGLMAIPSILLAIAVVSLSGASLMTVMVAITIPEIPRVARLVRSVVLSTEDLRSGSAG